MTANNDNHNQRFVTVRNRRVKKQEDGLFYVQEFKHHNPSSLVQADGEFENVSKGYAHSTSAFAALGRLTQKNISEILYK